MTLFRALVSVLSDMVGAIGSTAVGPRFVSLGIDRSWSRDPEKKYGVVN